MRRPAEAERALDDARHDLAWRIAAVDAAIDALVYELYGLTDEEISLVKGNGKSSSKTDVESRSISAVGIDPIGPDTSTLPFQQLISHLVGHRVL